MLVHQSQSEFCVCARTPLFFLCVSVRSLLLLLLFSTGLCNCSNILLHSLLHLSLSLSLSHSPESKGFYQGAPTRPDITGRGSVVVVVMEEEGEASYPLPHTWVLQGKSSPLLSSSAAALCITLIQSWERKKAVKFIYAFIILVLTSSIHLSIHHHSRWEEYPGPFTLVKVAMQDCC